MKLEVQQLTKTFKSKNAVNQVSFELEEGIHALLGANGSGKTTLLRMISGVIKPSKGCILFEEADIQKTYTNYVKHLGYLPQDAGFYMDFTILEFLYYIAALKCLDKEYTDKKIKELLQRLNLFEHRKKRMRHLSGGMMQRVGIAQSLLNHPKVLILDEPSSGLDPKERIALRQLLSQLSKDTIVILSTHIVSDVENIADDIMIMKEGEILFKKTVSDTLSILNGKVFEIFIHEQETYETSSPYILVNRKKIENGYLLRVICDEMKDETSIEVEPLLDDVYLYYFAKENDNVENDLL